MKASFPVAVQSLTTDYNVFHASYRELVQALYDTGASRYVFCVNVDAVIAGSEFAKHSSVNHSIGEYVRGDAHINTAEGYFSIFKRGVYGTFHHVSQQHLKRYLAEFDFRYNEREALGISDAERMSKSIDGIVGKRMTYRRHH
jgi:ISXO2-like transposase domain